MEPYMSDDSGCRLGLDSTSAACYNETSELTFEPYSKVDMRARMCIVHSGYNMRQVVIDIANELDVPATCHTFHRNSVYDFKCAPLRCLVARLPSSAPRCMPSHQDAHECSPSLDALCSSAMLDVLHAAGDRSVHHRLQTCAEAGSHMAPLAAITWHCWRAGRAA